MAGDADHYPVFYADKLWALIPSVYREEDAGEDGTAGPLRELVDRVGAQVAVVRRSVDRLWEDQSIETSDDWVIPYIGDLLATNLVASLGGRGQRLDVAKTIYYRRRKGTLAVLEEIASDITGWDARVVEFFRRLERSRHCFDPAIGRPADTAEPAAERDLQAAQGLVGGRTSTQIGGYADLRNAYGATKAHSPFDELFHTADLRRGRGRSGWYNIPRLGVFLWRLRSFGVVLGTPVAVAGCPGHFAFDPTGRLVPLFAKPTRSFGDEWVSPEEWQLPTPIDRRLLAAERAHLYPESVEVLHLQGSFFDGVASGLVTLHPELGRFSVGPGLAGDTFRVGYHYGFSAAIGAGPYDRRVARRQEEPAPTPVATVSGGANALSAPLTGLTTGTVVVGDSATYDAVADVGTVASGIQDVRVQAANRERPVVRLAAGSTWVFTGAAGSALELTGLLVSGPDIVLRGSFDTVRISSCTFDPGGSGLDSVPATVFATSVDGRDLVPTRVWVEAQVRRVEVVGCILGPIATRAGGDVGELVVRDSILQAVRTTDPSSGQPADLALDLDSGTVDLERGTVLGPARVHRLEASECVLDDVVEVEDTQNGCVRFSAWATGSSLPRRYECVEVSPGAPLFTSRVFGQPGYGQLLAEVDRRIVSGAAGASVAEGGPAGSEMGAFARELGPIKQRSIRIKYQEFMPLGLDPVVVNVT